MGHKMSKSHDNDDIVSDDTEEVVRPAHDIIDHLTDINAEKLQRDVFTLITGNQGGIRH